MLYCKFCNNVIALPHQRIQGYFTEADAKRMYGYDTYDHELADEDMEREPTLGELLMQDESDEPKDPPIGRA